MADDAAVLLAFPGQEAGHVDERDQRDVEGVAESHKAGALVRGVDVEGAGDRRRLLGHDAYSAAVEPGKADDDVPRPLGVHLQEAPAVHDSVDDVQHVVGPVGLVRHDAVECRIHAAGWVVARAERRIVEIVRREVRQQLADELEAMLLGTGGEVGYAADARVSVSPAQLFEGNVLAGDLLDHAGPGDEHVRGLAHHQDEIGDGRRVHSAPGARAKNGRDLRDDAGSQGIAVEDVGVAGQAEHALLNAGAA